MIIFLQIEDVCLNQQTQEMLLKGSSKHPFFVRLDERERILQQTSPDTLLLDNEEGSSVQSFLKLFKMSIEEQFAAFSNAEEHHAETFSKLLSTRKHPDSVSLLCAFLDNLLDFDFHGTISSLLPYSTDLIQSCSHTLISQASEHQKYPFLIRTILLLMGTLLSEQTELQDGEENKSVFLRTTITLLSQDLIQASLTFEGLKRFLRKEEFRNEFIEADGVNLLNQLLLPASKLAHTDTTYHILFCFWALTFSSEGLRKLSEMTFVKELARLLSIIQPEREEIVRLLINIISQLNSFPLFVETAFDNDILRFVRLFQTKHYVDPDLSTTIASTAEKLSQNLRHLSLWDKYVREVKSGHLHFTISHKSEIFWKSNIERFGDNQYEIIVLLTKLLESEEEETVLVACHDLGEFVSRSPVGKQKFEELGTKLLIMELLKSRSEQIKREALRTTQLMLLHQ